MLPGYQFANWEQGYGDVAVQPDLATHPPHPVARRDRARGVRRRSTRTTANRSRCRPGASCSARSSAPPTLGYTMMFASELEFFLFRESLDEAAAKGYTNLTPHSHVIEDYHILQTTRDEYLIRAIRNGVDGAGVPVEFSKGEAGRGPARDQPRVRDAGRDGRPPRDLQERRQGDRVAARPRRSRSWRSTPTDEVGSSCHVHSSLWDADGIEPLMWDADAPDHLSPAFRGWLGGQIACGRELAWMFAPTVNSYKRYQPESWAPTALAWSVDNRTCGFRVVGHGPSFRLESRIPGGDVNPYLAYAATIAAGLHGIEHGARAAAALRRQRVRGRRRCSACRRASPRRSTRSRSRRSRSTRSAPTCTTTC